MTSLIRLLGGMSQDAQSRAGTWGLLAGGSSLPLPLPPSLAAHLRWGPQSAFQGGSEDSLQGGLSTGDTGWLPLHSLPLCLPVSFHLHLFGRRDSEMGPLPGGQSSLPGQADRWEGHKVLPHQLVRWARIQADASRASTPDSPCGNGLRRISPLHCLGLAPAQLRAAGVQGMDPSQDQTRAGKGEAGQAGATFRGGLRDPKQESVRQEGGPRGTAGSARRARWEAAQAGPSRACT